MVQRSLEELARHRTTLVIAHRLSTIQNAGRILVLDEQGICEEGTHQQLLAQGGVYASCTTAPDPATAVIPPRFAWRVGRMP